MLPWSWIVLIHNVRLSVNVWHACVALCVSRETGGLVYILLSRGIVRKIASLQLMLLQMMLFFSNLQPSNKPTVCMQFTHQCDFLLFTKVLELVCGMCKSTCRSNMQYNIFKIIYASARETVSQLCLMNLQ